KSGGKLTGGGAYIGNSSGSNGTVSIADPGSTWSPGGSVEVGVLGTGSLIIANGGALSSRAEIDVGGGSGAGKVPGVRPRTINSASAYLGLLPGSTGNVTIDGVDGKWITTTTFSVGQRGSGKLDLNLGGTVQDSDGTIGAIAGSNGVVNVNDTNATWTNTDS